MKKVFALITLSFFYSGFSEACAPPRYPLDYQVPSYRYIINSPEIVEALLALGAHDIESIRSLPTSYLVTSSTGCYLDVGIAYKNHPEPGMCPEFSGIVINKRGCKK